MFYSVANFAVFIKRTSASFSKKQHRRPSSLQKCKKKGENDCRLAEKPRAQWFGRKSVARVTDSVESTRKLRVKTHTTPTLLVNHAIESRGSLKGKRSQNARVEYVYSMGGGKQA